MLKRHDATQTGGRRRLGRIFPHDTDARASAERHADQLADLQDFLQGRRHGVRVGPGPAVKRDHLGDAGFDFSEEIGHRGRLAEARQGFKRGLPTRSHVRGQAWTSVVGTPEWAAIRAHMRDQKQPMQLATTSWRSVGML